MTGLAAVVISASAWAQSIPTADIERQHLDPAAVGSYLVNNGETLHLGDFRFNVFGQYGYSPMGGVPVAQSLLMTNRVTPEVSVAVGLTDWLELSGSLPFVAYQDRSAPLSALSTYGVGSSFVQARFGILRSALNLSAGVGIGLPLGRANALTNQGVEVMPKVAIGHRYQHLQVGVELSALLRRREDFSHLTGGMRDVLGSDINLGAMVSSLGRGTRAELSGRLVVPLTGASVGAEFLVGVRQPLGEWVELFALVGPGFGGAPANAAFRTYLGAAFGHTGAACEEGKPYALADCPDLDRDGDGVKNALDSCPEIAGPINGCPEGDKDSDGVLDRADKCPDQPGPADNAGCPDTDRDGDGIPDRLDKCPDQPEDKDGFEDSDGCPDPDNDKDGILDSVDACPNEPGIPEERGCPEKDTDKDGVPDQRDNCKTEPGPAENQGCPTREKQLVVLTKEKLQILEKVYFATGKAKVLPKSYKLLDQIANVLKEHENIKQVQVEGHTDSTGTPEKNMALSQARAEAVRDYLIKKGVDGSRVVAKGFGQEKPADTNDTPAGRENNRRVEFNIVQE